MKLPDVNLLLYAYDDQSPRHERAKAWLEETLAGPETVAFAWAVLLAFLRISTHPRIFERPLAPEAALDLVDAWLAQPAATIAHPTPGHARVLRDLLLTAGTAGNLVPDAHLAALAVEHGAELCSSDADFSRFAGVHWVDPLR